MAIEQKWPAIPPRLFAANGTEQGVITVADASGFKVKMKVAVGSNTKPLLQLQVKRVLPNSIIVGPIPTQVGQQQLTSRQDLSGYLVSDAAFIYSEEQDKAKLKPDDIAQAVYEQEPAVANRVISVDQFGRPYNEANPLPVVGNITVDQFNYDAFQMDYDGDKNLHIVRYYLASVLVRTVTLNRDVDGDITSGTRV